MLAVVGPTASGKSDLAIDICLRFGGEVISCDSMQIYKRMNIGTAKPTLDEMRGIAHHLIDFLEPGTEYSASNYVADADRCVKTLRDRGVLPVFCGGTGLYIDSYISGLEFSDFENDPSVRERIEKENLEFGVGYIFERLKSVDSESAQAIDVHNVKRVIRALEVYETTGVTMSEWNRRSKLTAKKKDCLVIGLDYKDREKLYHRIDTRVDIMIDMGLIDEAKKLFDDGLMLSKTASQAIAYKELLPYFNGEDTLENCVEILKRNSRRYAKRQLTWFRRNKDIKWIFRDEKDDKQILEEAFGLVNAYLAEEN